jgi:integrase
VTDEPYRRRNTATPTSPTADAPLPRPPRAKPKRRMPPEILSDAEVRRLLAAIDDGDECGVRNRALLAVLYRAGLRISEALALLPKDLDLENGSLAILRGKGGRSRVVGIDPGAGGLVAAWLAQRQTRGHGRGEPVFCSRSGRPLTTAYMRRWLPELARKAGIDKRVHAHGFRHTHAAQLRSEGVDIGVISKQLGHTSIATTVRYLDHIAPVAIVAAIRKREWAA